MNPHLIVGAGPAGLSAIDTIREFGDSTPITLVCNEPAYSRMVLPYFMDGTIPETNVFTATSDYLQSRGVTALFEKKVTRLDDGTAHLDDGSTIEFGNALIATGSSAVRPPISGADGDGIFNLWTLDDARGVLGRQGGEVVVIGAGFIAFTCLDALVKLASRVTVVEVENQILPRMLDEPSAGLVQVWLENKGIEFRLGAKVEDIGDSNGRKHLSLTGGEVLEADVVVTATGIRPNIDIAQESGLETDFGIIVDEFLRTSREEVLAAGDIAQGPVVGSGVKGVHAIEPTAIEHGRVAGANMAGAAIPYWGSLLMNIVDVQKLQIASFGKWGDASDVRTIKNDSRPIYRKLVFEDDRIVGAIFLGPPNDVAMLNDIGMVKGLIQTQVHLKEWRAYLDRNPLDVRRPYVASRAAEELLRRRLLNKPSSPEGYRHPDPAPTYWNYHELFVKTKPDESTG